MSFNNFPSFCNRRYIISNKIKKSSLYKPTKNRVTPHHKDYFNQFIMSKFQSKISRYNHKYTNRSIKKSVDNYAINLIHPCCSLIPPRKCMHTNYTKHCYYTQKFNTRVSFLLYHFYFSGIL